MKSLVRSHARTMKQCLYDTIHHHPKLSIESIAEQLDMAPSYLYRAALPDMDMDGEKASGVRFPLKQIVPLIRITQDYQVLDHIEFTLGRVAVPLPPAEKKPVAEVNAAALNAVVKFGELIKEIQASLADGKITDEEQEDIDKEGRKAIQAIVVLLSGSV